MQRHPRGLYLLFVTEMAERFSYYGMRALLTLYIVAVFFTKDFASEFYGSYTGLVYLTPLFGGWVADRYWGNRRSIIVGGLVMALGQFLLYLSASFVNQSRATEGAVIDANVDNTLSLTLLLVGVFVLILGNGFFKPNISSMLGDLYQPADRLKDSAFTIFYMGINLGAFIAPLWCGFVGEGSAVNPWMFRWGFLSAAVAMLVSVGAFVLFKDKLLVAPDGRPVGLKPEPSQREQNIEKPKTRRNSPLRLILCIALFIGCFVLFAAGEQSITGYISAAIYSCCIAMPTFIITDRTLSRVDKDRIVVIYVAALFVIFFWAAFEQAGVTLTYFAAEQTDRTFGAWEMPASWFQSFNAIFVLMFAPLMAGLWQLLERMGIVVSSIKKQSLGLLLLAVGYLVISLGVKDVDVSTRVSILWLAMLYLLHTLGELSLSPIGMSMVSKLSPRHMTSLLMGVWFMSAGVSNIIAGKLATLYPVADDGSAVTKTLLGIEISTLDEFFLVFAVMASAAAVLLYCLSGKLEKMMHGVE